MVLMDPSYNKNNTGETSAESISHHADAADAGRSKVQVLSTSIHNPILSSSGTISDPLVHINSTLIETKLLTEMRIQDKSSPESPFQNCSATSNAEIYIRTNTQDNDTYGNMIHDGIGTGTGYASDLTMWILQALTKDGEKKRVGGDEFYITYADNNVILANSTINGRDFDSNNASSKDGATISTINEGNENNPPTAVAIVTDLRDGTYALKFKTTPFNRHPSNLSGIGLLTINLQFTCGIGSMPYPSKSNWTSSGRTNQKLTIDNVPQPPLQYYIQPSLPDLSKYRVVDFFGDSVVRMMVTGDGEWIPKKRRKYYKQNVIYSSNVRSHLSNVTVEHFTKHFMHCHDRGIRQNWRSVSVVMGSAAWDLKTG